MKQRQWVECRNNSTLKHVVYTVSGVLYRAGLLKHEINLNNI
jgi:hypothetical protein